MKIPSNMITAKELVEKLKQHGCPLTEKDIKQMAKEGHLPYLIWVLPVNGKKKRSEPLFQIGSTKQWMIDNGYFQEHEGDPSPKTFRGSKLIRRIEELEKKVESLIANQNNDVEIDLEDI